MKELGGSCDCKKQIRWSYSFNSILVLKLMIIIIKVIAIACSKAGTFDALLKLVRLLGTLKKCQYFFIGWLFIVVSFIGFVLSRQLNSEV